MRFARSIRFRVTAVAVVTTAVVVAAFSWLLLRLIVDDLVAAGEDELVELADDIEGLALSELGVGGAQYRLDGEDVSMELDLDDDGDILVELLSVDDPDGEPVGAFIVDSGTGEIREVLPEPGGLPEAELARIADVAAELLRDQAAGLADSRISLLESTEDVLDEIADAVGAARRAALLISPLLVLASGLITWFVVGRALSPTRRIAAEAAAIGTDTLDRRVSDRGTADEVDTIAGVINDMLDRIEAGVRREQQFVGDASHELRTPIATARMAAELAGQDAPHSPYPAQVVDEVDRMQTLVDDLLQLARGAERPVELVDVVAVAANAVGSHPATARIGLRSELERAPVRGRADDLGRVLANLLDNAARHGERIEVTLSSDSSSGSMDLLVAVDDDGPGVPEAERTRVFERFARLDEGRARNRGGAGLGLAIVDAIVTRHGGSVVVDDAPIGGARLLIRLPLVAVDPAAATLS
ncbi:MAG: HAMP domain-containing sensor histidine kinase [Actinomycetota bacterium]